jgi:hypothetical protein
VAAPALTDAERRLWGIRRDGDTLRLRPTGWVQLGTGAQIAVAGAFFLLLNKLGAERRLLVGVAASVVVGLWGLFQWLGTVLVSPEGLRVWWLGVRRIPWEHIEGFAVVTRAPLWAAGWPPFEVVEVSIRGGPAVTLWPTRSAAVPVAGAASAAAAQCGLLERYRATLSE